MTQHQDINQPSAGKHDILYRDRQRDGDQAAKEIPSHVG
ncbi:hypothetical protein SX4_0911 [Vibrio mimicus SX-4]|nr:hypothetical protein SX4_0911 [Vibrio mimicus SX-4]